jgi:phosphoglycolate phosphatase
MRGALKAVLFDLDGTLIETAPEISDAVNDALQAVGLEPVGLPMVRNWIGHGTATLLRSALSYRLEIEVGALDQWPSYAQAVQAFEAAYEARCGTRSHLYEDVRETLAVLKANGVRVAVVTNKEARFTERVLKAHQLDRIMDAVISGDTLATKKPNPAGIQHVMERFNVAPDECLFVGDSSIDAATAKAAGVTVWLLPYGYNMGQPLEACQPDAILSEFGDVLSALDLDE